MTDSKNDENSSDSALGSIALVELASQKAARIVSDEIIRREDQRAKRTTMIFSILAVIGISGVVGIIGIRIDTSSREAIDEKIATLDPIIEDKVRLAVENGIGGVRTLLEENERLENFLALTEELEEEPYIPVQTREAIMAHLRELSAVPRITSQDRFLSGLDTVIEQFASYSQSEQLNEIDSILGNLLKTRQENSLWFANHYGQLIIGSPYPLDRHTADLDRIQKYLEAAHSYQYPEIKVLWELLIEFKRTGNEGNDITDKLVESTGDLKDEDEANLLNDLFNYSDPDNWMTGGGNQEARELALVVSKLYERYPELVVLEGEAGE